MSSDFAVKVENLSKCYHIYDQPRDRLKQFFLPRLYRLAGLTSRNYYNEFWALKNVSFEIGLGETVGIVGRNGSGKSTLLQMICGTLNPTAGNVSVNGRIAALLELGSGFNAEFTGRENVYLNAAVLGLEKEEVDERFDNIAAFADIGEFIDQPVKTYSSGMFVRLAFAVVAHVDAQILVIDEALAVGDAFFTQKCMRFLRRFRESGTLIFVSHDTAAVTGLCDTAIWLNKGILQTRAAAKHVSEAYLASLYSADIDIGTGVRDGAGQETPLKRAMQAEPSRDCRAEEINNSILRNDLKVFDFRPGASADFGVGGAEILNVEIIDPAENKLVQVLGGEIVTLRVQVEARSDLSMPIVGFSVKDRLGQVLFGDNTYLSYKDAPVFVGAGNILTASFSFQMPILPSGDYSIAVAVATGKQDDHVQHHWVHDALIMKSISSSVSTGLVGIPMKSISLFMA